MYIYIHTINIKKQSVHRDQVEFIPRVKNWWELDLSLSDMGVKQGEKMNEPCGIGYESETSL